MFIQRMNTKWRLINMAEKDKESPEKEIISKPASGQEEEEGEICIYCGYRVKPGEYHHH